MKMTKEFNLEKFMNGAPAQNKLGNPVKFVCMTRGKMLVSVFHRYRVIGSFEKNVMPLHEGTSEKFYLNGKKYLNSDSVYDLEMVKPYEVLPKRDAKGRFVKNA